jgi:prolyl-tRNA synthetase
MWFDGMRTRLFLRTVLWQEGHTAHATKNRGYEESERMMNVYADFAENFMAIPVVKDKTETERLLEQKKLIALKH